MFSAALARHERLSTPGRVPTSFNAAKFVLSPDLSTPSVSRTRDLLLRRQAPCPLGDGGMDYAAATTALRLVI